uniref:Gamma-aminobutyric acid receptor alpha-like n=1 Tax=Macrostomum lignano TaxID=282301 RepID=A0A1I8IWN6_9PLAT
MSPLQPQLLILTALLLLLSQLDASSFSAAAAGRATADAVTDILDNLLLSYDKSMRPHHSDADGIDGPPVSVRISINIRSMGPISDKDMTFSMDCYFRQLWRDARLNFNQNSSGFASFQLNEKFLHEIWRPDTHFLNGHASYLHNITSPNVLIRITSAGEILYSMRLTIKAHCPMDFHRYPMDTQHCPLHIGSHGYAGGDLTYSWRYARRSIETAANLMMSQFDLVKVSTSGSVRPVARLGNFSVLSVSFVLKRHVGYFLIQLYLPCALLVVLSWVSFWLNREATADRVALGITTVLTMAFLFMDSRADLPRVSYSTAIDWYVAICFTFVLSTLLQFAAVHYFTKAGTGELYLVLDGDGPQARLRTVESRDLICATQNGSRLQLEQMPRQADLQQPASFAVGPIRHEPPPSTPESRQATDDAEP